jgi:hypothetical protein
MNTLTHLNTMDRRAPSTSVLHDVAMAPDKVVTWIRSVVTQPEVFEAYNQVMADLIDSGPLQAAIKLTVSVAARSLKRARTHPCCPGEATFHCKAA